MTRNRRDLIFDKSWKKIGPKFCWAEYTPWFIDDMQNFSPSYFYFNFFSNWESYVHSKFSQNIYFIKREITEPVFLNRCAAEFFFVCVAKYLHTLKSSQNRSTVHAYFQHFSPFYIWVCHQTFPWLIFRELGKVENNCIEQKKRNFEERWIYNPKRR